MHHLGISLAQMSVASTSFLYIWMAAIYAGLANLNQDNSFDQSKVCDFKFADSMNILKKIIGLNLY